MYKFDDSISVHRMKCVAAYHRDANLWKSKISCGDPLFAVPTFLPSISLEPLSPVKKHKLTYIMMWKWLTGTYHQN